MCYRPKKNITWNRDQSKRYHMCAQVEGKRRMIKMHLQIDWPGWQQGWKSVANHGERKTACGCYGYANDAGACILSLPMSPL